jgi:hypothetical protein
MHPMVDVTPHDIEHTEDGALTTFDGGKMDNFDLQAWGNVNGEFLAYRQFTGIVVPGCVFRTTGHTPRTSS